MTILTEDTYLIKKVLRQSERSRRKVYRNHDAHHGAAVQTVFLRKSKEVLIYSKDLTGDMGDIDYLIKEFELFASKEDTSLYLFLDDGSYRDSKVYRLFSQASKYESVTIKEACKNFRDAAFEVFGRQMYFAVGSDKNNMYRVEFNENSRMAYYSFTDREIGNCLYRMSKNFVPICQTLELNGQRTANFVPRHD